MPEIIENFFAPELCEQLANHIRPLPSQMSFMGNNRYVGHLYAVSSVMGHDINTLEHIGLHRRLFHRTGHITQDVMWNHYPRGHALVFHQDEQWEEITVVNLDDKGSLHSAHLPGYLDVECSVPEVMRRAEDMVILPSVVGTALRWTSEEEQDGWFHGGLMQAGRISLVIRHNRRRNP